MMVHDGIGLDELDDLGALHGKKRKGGRKRLRRGLFYKALATSPVGATVIIGKKRHKHRRRRKKGGGAVDELVNEETGQVVAAKDSPPGAPVPPIGSPGGAPVDDPVAPADAVEQVRASTDAKESEEAPDTSPVVDPSTAPPPTESPKPVHMAPMGTNANMTNLLLIGGGLIAVGLMVYFLKKQT